jgi:hypothetical protein
MTIDSNENVDDSYLQAQQEQERQEWLADEKAQIEYKNWLDKKDSENVKHRANREYLPSTKTPF